MTAALASGIARHDAGTTAALRRIAAQPLARWYTPHLSSSALTHDVARHVGVSSVAVRLVASPSAGAGAQTSSSGLHVSGNQILDGSGKPVLRPGCSDRDAARPVIDGLADGFHDKHRRAEDSYRPRTR